MSTVQYSVTYVERHSRLTTFFRGLLVLPHSFVAGVWSIGANFCSFFQWWIIMFTGKRSQGLWLVQKSWLGYAARVQSYATYMFDKWPAFGAEADGEPITYSFDFEAKASRLRTFFQPFIAIPAMFVMLFAGIGFLFYAFICFWAILFTGKQPRGLFDYMLKFHRFMVDFVAFNLYMTDSSPKFGA